MTRAVYANQLKYDSTVEPLPNQTEKSESYPPKHAQQILTFSQSSPISQYSTLLNVDLD